MADRNKNTTMDPKDLIYPLFVKEGRDVREEIESMPGVYRLSPDVLSEEIKEISRLGLNKVLIFGVPDKKDEQGSASYVRDNIVAAAVRLVKEHAPGITVMTDVCLCAYTSHGHCGIIRPQTTDHGPQKNWEIDREATLDTLGRIAVTHAAAGADYVAPSAMTKGQVGTIRKALDSNGYEDVKIMAYSAKFASKAYGPFRNVADSAPRFGDRKGYQLDHSSTEEALARIEKDISEGADIVMVKPALWYLDIVKEAKTRISIPLAVYNVSGEYAMVKEGAKAGLWDEEEIVDEIVSSMRRAGADLIITYHAKEIARRAL